MKSLLLGFISLYQKKNLFSEKRNCVFYPTCSEYAKEAINKYGAWNGSRLAFLRILRCHPWQKNHIDPLK